MATRKWADIRLDKMGPAIQAAQRMVAHGERPLYRATVVHDGAGFVVVANDLPVRARVDRRADAADAIRAAIAELLEIPADVLDVTLADRG